MIDQPPAIQEEIFTSPIHDINEFYDRMVFFSGESATYPGYHPVHSLNSQNLDTWINYSISKAKEYFQGEDRKYIIKLIKKARQYLLEGENLEAAYSFAEVRNHMHEISER
jgi:hypothetical protein